MLCKRALGKTITWRVSATAITGLCAYIITGQIDTALQITSIEFFVKMLAYYVHERIWEKIT